jgi:hypothetical protein
VEDVEKLDELPSKKMKIKEGGDAVNEITGIMEFENSETGGIWEAAAIGMKLAEELDVHPECVDVSWV